MNTDPDESKSGWRELGAALERAVAATGYVHRGQRISADQMKRAYRNRIWGDETWPSYAAADLTTPADVMAGFADALRPFLASYLDPRSDHVGDGFSALFGGLGNPTVPEFGERLVDGAVKLGACRVTELLRGWIAGEPFYTRRCAILEGATIEEPLRLDEGVRIARLPRSSGDLSASLPQFSVLAQDLLGSVVLSIDFERTPSLYKPEPGRALLGQEVAVATASNKIPDLFIDRFCESMALACGEYVDWRLSWIDHGDLEAFSRGYRAHSTKPTWGARSTTFAQRDLERAREIHRARHTSGSTKTRKALDLAIRRWLKSKQALEDPDALIELRIALEALYGEGTMNEKTFRVSTYGAWHLGRTVTERREVRETLRKAYADASQAIHAGSCKHTTRDKQLLPTAQKYCWRGILKRLEESEEPEWDELIVGGYPPALSEEP